MDKKFKLFKRRIEKSLEMDGYKFSLVREKTNGTKIFLVHGGTEEYRITIYGDPKKKTVCSCFDYERANKEGIYCKHIIKLFHLLGQEGELLSILFSERNNNEP